MMSLSSSLAQGTGLSSRRRGFEFIWGRQKNRASLRMQGGRFFVIRGIQWGADL